MLDNRYCKGNDEYATPDWIKQGLFKDWFDPCPLSKESGTLNGLSCEWRKRTFVNPPYSNPAPWFEKAIVENRKGKTIALLLKHDTSTKWWSRLHEAGAYFLPVMGRLHFSGLGPAPFPSVIAILSSNLSTFTPDKSSACLSSRDS